MSINPLIALDQWLLLTLLLLGGTLYLSWRSTAALRLKLRLVILVLRGLVAISIALVALNIGEWRYTDRSERPCWQVVVDRSGSMATMDVAGKSRWQAALTLAGRLEAESKERRTLIFTPFSDGLEAGCQSVADLEKLVPDGRASLIGDAVMGVSDRLASTAATGVRGIVLLSDGRETGVGTVPRQIGLRARAQQAPLLVVPLGAEREKRDIAVHATRKLLAGFVDQEVRVQGEVAAHWPGEIGVTVELVEADSGAVVATNVVQLHSGERERFSFSIRPRAEGVGRWSLRVEPWEGESNTDNNESAFEIQTLERKIAVLLLEGAPFWESKFLGQLLRRQPHLALTAVQRTAPGRFITVASDGSSESIEDGIFPDTAAALGAYDVVIFGKGAEYFMTPARSLLLQRFVAEQGGAVIFARGRPTIDASDLLQELEPVAWGGESALECRLQPTVVGEESGLFAGLLPGSDDPVWRRLPLLRSSHASVTLKSFAQVLAAGARSDGTDELGRRLPLLVSRRFGKGVTVALNIDGLWQWAFFPTSEDAGRLYEELWTQLLLWVGTYSEFLPGQSFALHLGSSTTLPERPVRVVVRQRSGIELAGGGEPLQVVVNRAGEKVQELALAATSGGWEGLLYLSEPGEYRVTLRSKDGDASAPSALLVVTRPQQEGEELNPDLEFLRVVAESSGGKVVRAENLLHEIEQHETATAKSERVDGQAVWESLWDRGWLLALIMAALTVEWVVRRRNGLS